MKKRIEHLLNGKIQYDMPALLFSKDRIQVSLPEGESLRDEVYLGAEDHRKIRGYVTSSSRRIVPGLREFSGTTVCLPFGIDTAGLHEGEQISGWLCFVTTVGEYKLSFEITVTGSRAEGSGEQICTLSEFVLLAKENFREAYRMFNSPAFSRIIRKASGREKAWYAGFTGQPITYQSLEEFLIACKKKDPVTIALPQKEREIYGLKESVREPVKITRKGWGHLRLTVETRGDFLETGKHLITDEDFIGSSYVLEYIIRYDRLGEGRQYGEIRISSPYETLIYEIVVSKSIRTSVNLRREERRRRADLLQDYLEYRCSKVPLKEWAASAHYQLNRLKEAGQNYPEYTLYESYLCCLEGKTEQAGEILKSFREKPFRSEEREMAGIYLWLCVLTGLYKDKATAVSRLESFYRQKEDSPWLLLALLDLKPEFQNSASGSVFAMEEYFQKGGRSPLIYLRAWEILQKDQNPLRRLSEFWIQVFCFAADNDLLTQELCMRFAYLSGYEKTWNPCLYRTLSAAFLKFQDNDTLEAVCRYIIHGNPRRPEYFRWYEEAVNRGLRITRLYEYFMETLDPTRKTDLPLPLLLYFAYNNKLLGAARRAYLYAWVVDHREEHPEIYGSYEENIRAFAFQSLKEGRVSESCSRLYQEFCMEPDSPEMANALGIQLHTFRLYCGDTKIRNVIIRQEQMEKEEVFPCISGVAYPRIYTEDAVILFQDEHQRRYGSTIPFNCQKLMDSHDGDALVMKRGASACGIYLAGCQGRQIDQENLAVFGKMVEMEGFSKPFRRKIRKEILDFYRVSERTTALDMYLKNLDLDAYAEVDRNLFLQLLIEREYDVEACEVIRRYGYEGMDRQILMKLSGRMCQSRLDNDPDREEPDEELLQMTDLVFREGYYDEWILSYLMHHKMGPIEELLKILHSAHGFELDTYAFEEKILCLLMFAKDFRKEGEKVLEEYVRKAGKERMIAAFLTHVSYGYFVREYPITKFTVSCLKRAYENKWPVKQICHLALFKALSKSRESSEQIRREKEALLRECMDDRLVFSFFRKLPGEMLSPYQLDDKVFVECHAPKNAKVTLYYEMDQGLGESVFWQTEPLQEMYEGIFVRTFTLFYGEALRYYFVIEEDGKQRKTPEKVLTMSRIEGTEGSRYLLLNEILSERKLERLTQAADLTKQYLKQDQFAETMFTIQEESDYE